MRGEKDLPKLFVPKIHFLWNVEGARHTNDKAGLISMEF